MLDQTITAKSLFRLLKASDSAGYSMGKTRDEKLNILGNISSEINDDTFQFSTFETFKRNGNFVFKTKSINDEFAIRKVNSNLKRIFKVRQTDRQTVVNQIKILLEEGTPYHIVKLDIKGFFESLKRKRILNRIWSDPIISYRTKVLVERLLTTKQFEKLHGLPRGLSVSSTLSEEYLRDFDQLVNQIPGVYYSARYVDDIIIFCISNPKNVYKKVEDYLREINLTLNGEKSKIYSDLNHKANTEIDYLGYRFKKNSNGVSVTIAPKKIKKIKTRIVQSFLDHVRSRDPHTLSLRIKFLTGNQPLDSRSKVTGSPLKSGIFYNYSQMTEDSDELRELDRFLVKLIYSKNGSLGKRIASSLSYKEKKNLSRYSFEHGYRERITHRFSFSEIKVIRKCWDNG